MVRNLPDGPPKPAGPRHVGLVTGLNHYLGPFEAYGKGALPQTPFREEQGRLDVENFYYAQEDELFAAAARDGFTWSVHRPHTVIGKAVGNAMNMGTTLALYATLCKEAGQPFRFPGSAMQWNCLTDMTDARQLARHLLWAAATPAAHDEAFNVVDGDIFAGSGCRGGSPVGSALSRRRSTARRGRSWKRWRTRRRRGVGSPSARGWLSPTLVASPRLALAHRRRSGPADRGRDGHVQEPASGVHRLPATDDAFFDLFGRLRADRLIP